MWAGIECTVNRVGDRYFDQLERNGHAGRVSDLDRLAALGVRTVRYPLLWERIEPEGPERADWSWADERMARLRELGMRPIVGLVHHGSGPRDTSLLDPDFPARLAAYARRVAERYPWVEDWTPVNEPLTTARFSALYGHWYPHRREPWSFARAFVLQCEAVREAMAAVREVIPHARLVQTEDLGKTYSTPALAYQARFENERRWATFDLLTGRLAVNGPFWRYLTSAGVSVRALEAFRDAPVGPLLLGVNHYLTSERLLDHRLDHYPPETHGGNGQQAYADVEAVRACAEGLAGPAALLAEVWERYRLPLAVTEAHLGCTREQQMRWLAEVWDAASALRAGGVDVRAVTAWSALGAYDWNSLLTRDAGHYEPGLFDVRGPEPRPTALARMVGALAQRGSHDHPALTGPRWWQEDRRLLYPAVQLDPRRPTRTVRASRRLRDAEDGTPDGTARPLLVTGATGTLGAAFARACAERGLGVRVLARAECDIADAASVQAALDGVRPWAVVNTAGYVRVDDAEGDRERCFRENTAGAATLARACAERHVPLATFSSDLVFDGDTPRAYVESDPVRPLGAYGESKARAERAVLGAHDRALVVRTSAFFGPWDDYNFATLALRALSRGEPVVAADDAVVSPTYVPDLVHTVLDLLLDEATGIWHLANDGAMTWAAFGRQVADRAGLDSSLVVGRATAALSLRAPRPRFSALTSERGIVMPTLENAICRYVDARAPEIVRRRPSVQQLA
jgi:dTDP-4-dehydrorhamnose reductase